MGVSGASRLSGLETTRSRGFPPSVLSKNSGHFKYQEIRYISIEFEPDRQRTILCYHKSGFPVDSRDSPKDQ